MIQTWLGEEFQEAIRVIDEASVSQVREAVREVGRAQGLEGSVVERAVAAASELGHNQRLHAGGGMVAVHPCRRGSVPGLEIIAADRGPGLFEPGVALRGVPKTPSQHGSLGIGLSAARRLCDEMDIDSRMGEGSCFWLRKFAEPVVHGREVAIWGKPKAGELVSGDDAAFVRTETSLLVLVADGLGHGQSARNSSARVAETIRKEAHQDLTQLINSSDARLNGMRGAAVTLARIHDQEGVVECAAVGNVRSTIETREGSSSFGSEQWTVGVQSMRRKVKLERKPFDSGAVLLLQSDGVSSRARLSAEPQMFVEHPLIAAHFVATTFGRDTDDVIVALVR